MWRYVVCAARRGKPSLVVLVLMEPACWVSTLGTLVLFASEDSPSSMRPGHIEFRRRLHVAPLAMLSKVDPGMTLPPSCSKGCTPDSETSLLTRLARLSVVHLQSLHSGLTYLRARRLPDTTTCAFAFDAPAGITVDLVSRCRLVCQQELQGSTACKIHVQIVLIDMAAFRSPVERKRCGFSVESGLA